MLTVGEMFYWGGVVGIAFFSVMLLFWWGVYKRKMKKLAGKIQKDLGL